VDLPDFTTYTDDDLRALGDAVSAERDKRNVLAVAVANGTALAQEYAAAGGDVQAALDQIAAAVTTTTPPPPADGTTDGTPS